MLIGSEPEKPEARPSSSPVPERIPTRFYRPQGPVHRTRPQASCDFLLHETMILLLEVPLRSCELRPMVLPPHRSTFSVNVCERTHGYYNPRLVVTRWLRNKPMLLI